MEFTRKASFFDVDGVIYKNIMGIDFMNYLHKNQLLVNSIWKRLSDTEKLYRIDKKLSSTQFYEECAKLWSQGILGKKKRTIESEARLFARDMIGKVSKRAHQAIKKDKDDGYMTILITGSPVEVVQSLSDLLNAHHAIGTEVTEKNGRYTGKLVKPWPVGQGKAKWVKRVTKMFKIDLAKSKAYGNSELDIPMLELVGTPLAINPNDKLKKVACERSWETDYW